MLKLDMKKIAIIIPCYNEAAALPYFLREIRKVADQMSATKPLSFEFLFVNDGSKDQTLDILREAAKQDKRVRYISFSRNLEKKRQCMRGFKTVPVITQRSWTQICRTRPALLPEMYEALQGGEYDSVATRRADRRASRRSAAFLHGASTKLLTGFQMQTSSMEHETSA